jgi:hypothetical protein
MAKYRNTQASSYSFGKVEGTTKPYAVGGAGATTPAGVRLDLIDIAEAHLAVPGIKKCIDEKILVPYDGKDEVVAAAAAPKTPEPAKKEPPVPDLTAGVTGSPMVSKTEEEPKKSEPAKTEAKASEGSKEDVKAARKAQRRAANN